MTIAKTGATQQLDEIAIAIKLANPLSAAFGDHQMVLTVDIQASGAVEIQRRYNTRLDRTGRSIYHKHTAVSWLYHAGRVWVLVIGRIVTGNRIGTTAQVGKALEPIIVGIQDIQTLQGIEGQLFADLALTLSVAVAASTLAAMTILPVARLRP